MSELLHRQLGQFDILRIGEYEGPFVKPGEFFPDFDPELIATASVDLRRLLDAETGMLIMSFHSYVVRTGRHTIVIDTCGGNDKKRPAQPRWNGATTGYLAELEQAGVRPEEVDFVMCTHLHWDHVGWNTRLVDGKWMPTFPNARYIVARKEYEFWDAAHARGDESMHSLAFADSVMPLMRAERALLVEQDFALDDGIWLEAASGHTPGNVVINVRSRGRRGVFPGDVLHSPLQLSRPEWSTRACWDPELSRGYRRRFIEEHADTENLVMPAHFPAPYVGRIVRTADGFGFTP